MSQNTGIQWTDATWNPIRGCSRVSEGCRNCYAERMAARFNGKGMPYEGLAIRSEITTSKTFKSSSWTGEVRFIEEHLEDPLHWKKPRRIFVNSMSDLFHEKVSDAVITTIFDVMNRSRRHTFQILTKRPKRMMEFLSEYPPGLKDSMKILRSQMPLPNVWLGVSVEDQKTADERIPLLLQTPAAVRFISYEPALGPVTPRGITKGWCPTHDFPGGFCHGPCKDDVRLDWVIVGGESGPGARPFYIQWARDIIGQCKEAGIPVFLKQLGAQPFDVCKKEHCLEPVRKHNSVFPLKDRKGGDWSEWPEDLRVREFPECQPMTDKQEEGR